MKKHRLLFVSDPAYPYSNTGFGIVSGQLLKGLVDCNQFEIAHLARGMGDARGIIPPYRIYSPPAWDRNGYAYIATVIREEEPELIVIEADPGSVSEWQKNPEVRNIPCLVHCPVEGAPLLSPWAESMAQVLLMKGRITCYTEFTKQTIIEAVEFILANFHKKAVSYSDIKVQWPELEVLGLGNDHADFGRNEERRLATRRRHDWNKNFVVMNVARNAGRKQWPRLFEAIALLKDEFPQILLYAHTVPFENYFLQGHDLFGLRRYYGVEDYVVFKRDMVDPYNGIPYDGMVGETRETLADLYSGTDLFVAPTGGEGWNLPVIEAAKCGLPVVTTAYGGGWEVAKDFAYPLMPSDWQVDPHGMRFAMIKAEDIAKAIKHFILHPEELKERAQMSIENADRFKWEPTVKRFTEIALEMVS